jgi:hypothetical protein
MAEPARSISITEEHPETLVGRGFVACIAARLSRSGAVMATDDEEPKVVHLRWRTRDAGVRAEDESLIYDGLIKHRDRWPALVSKATVVEQSDGWLVGGRYHVPRAAAGRIKDTIADRWLPNYIDFYALLTRYEGTDRYAAAYADLKKHFGFRLPSEIEAERRAEEERLEARFSPRPEQPTVSEAPQPTVNGPDVVSATTEPEQPTEEPEPEAAPEPPKGKKKRRSRARANGAVEPPSPGSDGEYQGGIRPEDIEDFVRDKHSAIVADSQRNVRLAVKKLSVELSHDAFASRLLINGLGGGLRHLGDPEIERLYLTIDETFKFRPGRELFWMIIRDEARRHSFHPVKQYLDGLRWDGKPRLDTWLTYYAGADDTLYTRAVGRLVLIAAVRRVRHPGVKFDEMLVLESEQGLNKSQALRVLAVRAEWFSDDLPLNVGSKEVIERLDGRWIVEAAELSGMRQGQVEHIKAFLSRQYDRARLSYDRMPTERPRQCILIGTTNADTYLKDSSGNRRFWPVKIGAFDLDALSHDRDQLWAEAAEAEAEGESIRLDASLYGAAGQQQTQRRVLDPWIGALRAAIGHIPCGKMRCEDAWVILDLKAAHRTPDHNQRLGDAMKQLNWKHKRKRFAGGKPVWAYCIDDGSQLTVLPLPEIVVFRDGQTNELQITVKDTDPSGSDEPRHEDGDDLFRIRRSCVMKYPQPVSAASETCEASALCRWGLALP